MEADIEFEVRVDVGASLIVKIETKYDMKHTRGPEHTVDDKRV